jgi:hypothetical protein
VECFAFDDLKLSDLDIGSESNAVLAVVCAKERAICPSDFVEPAGELRLSALVTGVFIAA